MPDLSPFSLPLLSWSVSQFSSIQNLQEAGWYRGDLSGSRGPSNEMQGRMEARTSQSSLFARRSLFPPSSPPTKQPGKTPSSHHFFLDPTSEAVAFLQSASSCARSRRNKRRERKTTSSSQTRDGVPIDEGQPLCFMPRSLGSPSHLTHVSHLVIWACFSISDVKDGQQLLWKHSRRENTAKEEEGVR